MFAVVRTGGRQYRVTPNDVIIVERLAGESGGTIALDDVLLVGDGNTTALGRPRVEGAQVAAEILDQARADKIIVFKFKRRKKYRRTAGHRQNITVLRITEIRAPGMTATAAPRNPEPRGDSEPAPPEQDEPVAGSDAAASAAEPDAPGKPMET